MHIHTPEELFDAPFRGTSERKRAPRWLGIILWIVVSFLCKVLTRYRVHGIEHIRQFEGKKGAVVACTHASFLDIAYMYCPPHPRQWMRLMARDSLFNNPMLSFIFSRGGAFPVARDTADRTSIKRAVRMLKEGELVGIFPEGTRRGKTDRVPEIHGGAALVARMAKAPIVPATIRNAEYVKEKGKFVRFPRVDVFFGKPISVEAFDFLPKEQRLEGCMWYVMRECFAMKYGVEPREVDMVSLFPTGYDFTRIFEEHPIER